MKAILLAAGSSRRFGGNKLLEPFRGKPLYQHTLSLIQNLYWEEIILVTQYEEICKNEQDKVTIVKNPHPERGIAGSIGLGVMAAGQGFDLMFFVCDQPYLKQETVEGMREKFLKNPNRIICAESEKRTGNPNIFPASYYEELLGLKGDKGGKRIIKAHPDQVTYYQVDETELKDFDYKTDFNG